MLKYSYPTNERQQMTQVEHVLRFVTEVDETNPTGAQLLALDDFVGSNNGIIPMKNPQHRHRDVYG